MHARELADLGTLAVVARRPFGQAAQENAEVPL
jgi:hypothetical protein